MLKKIIFILLIFLLPVSAMAEGRSIPLRTSGGNFTWTADGNGTASTFQITKGIAQFTAYGTWGGATAKLQFRADDDSTWIDMSSVSCTANCSITFRESQNTPIRAVVSGTTTTAIKIEYNGLEQ